MAASDEQAMIDRRTFVSTGVRTTAGLGLGGLALFLGSRSSADGMVWQIDPGACVQCEQCATHCVVTPSAVKCVHAFDVCGYCNLCGGFLATGAKVQDTAAEHLLCPTDALKRRYIERPFYEYTIEEDLCIGCSRCVKGCNSFGNGSLHLQIRHDLCLNCNECAIARECPADAFRRVPASQPSLMKGRARNV